MGKSEQVNNAKLVHDLGERVKELECLYGIARLEEMADLSSSEIYQSIVDLIPSSWQHSDVACARITLNGQEFRTANFKKSRWRQSEDILFSGSAIGAVDVCYLKKRPEADEGPFLKEERDLIDAVAGRLGMIHKHRLSLDRVQGLAKFPSENPFPVMRIKKDGKILYANEASNSLLFDWGRAVGQPVPDYLRKLTAKIFRSKKVTKDILIKHENRTLSFSAMPILDSGYVNFYGRDVTENKKRENRLELLSEAVESVSYGIQLTDLKGNFIYTNAASSKLTGYTKKEYLGMSADQIPPDPDETSNVIIPTVMKTGQWDDESLVKRKDGSLVPVWLTISIAKDTDGKPMALVSTAKDISDIKKAREDLQKSEEWSRNIIESAQEGIWVLDKDSKTTFVNDQMTKILGYNENEMMGRSILDFMDADAKKDAVYYMKRREQGISETHDFCLMSKSGENVWVMISTTPLLGEDGEFQGAFGMVTDVTDRKEMENVLAESEKRLRRTLGGTVKALSSMTALRDPYTVGHQERVSKLACAIGDELGFTEDRLQGLRTATDLHDVGKVNVPAEILTKPGKINELEYKIIQYHVQAGFDILHDIDFPWPVADIVLQHHERLNGSGYPHGLSGSSILEEARIIAVADVVEAMSSRRPYRAGLGIGVALKEISKNKGILYDPKVVDVCLRLFRKEGFDFRSESREKAA